MGHASRSNPNNQIRTAQAAGLSKQYIYDRYRRPLRAGHMIHLNQPFQGDWQVEDVQPVSADPRFPPHTLLLTVVVRQTIPVQGGTSLPDVLLALPSAAPAIREGMTQEEMQEAVAVATQKTEEAIRRAQLEEDPPGDAEGSDEAGDDPSRRGPSRIVGPDGQTIRGL